MIRVKHPIEYKLTPDAVERGSHWLTVRIKNTGDNDLQNLNVKMHSLDSIHISFRNPNHYIYDLEPNEEKYFEVEALWWLWFTYTTVFRNVTALHAQGHLSCAFIV